MGVDYQSSKILGYLKSNAWIWNLSPTTIVLLAQGTP